MTSFNAVIENLEIKVSMALGGMAHATRWLYKIIIYDEVETTSIMVNSVVSKLKIFTKKSSSIFSLILQPFYILHVKCKIKIYFILTIFLNM